MNNELALCLLQISAQCRELAGVPITPLGVFPTQRDIEEHAAAVNEQCDLLEAMAARAEGGAEIALEEFQGVMLTLRGFDAHPTPESHRAVQRAFAFQGR
ncbi:hypothetical protein B9J07_25660 [Sinorhizobium sp. LM21]|nr:hypothetical protein phi3LM21_p55 [Sinorhizobium phage phi3LM21]OWZ90944.1 hypothetical protein B9J07_25660 [Sinorhizobium sp. LM21]